MVALQGNKNSHLDSHCSWYHATTDQKKEKKWYHSTSGIETKFVATTTFAMKILFKKIN